MILEYKELSDVTLDDIQSLIESKYSEKRNIDYKLKLPETWNDDAKKKFLSDVCAFANTDGGFLLFGISESETIPVEVIGIPIAELEKNLQTMTGIINNGIQPRLLSVNFQIINIDEFSCVLIISIRKSLNQPHLVSFSGFDRFYHRVTIGNEKMDVYQIRQAFLSSTLIFERIKRWRLERISEIQSNNTFPLSKTGKIVLHIVPLEFERELQNNTDLAKVSEYGSFPSLDDSLTEARFNADGVLHYYQTERQPDLYVHYSQLFRNRNLEAVDTRQMTDGFIPYISFEVNIVKCVILAMKMYPKLGITSPIVIMLSLLDVQGVSMSTNNFRIDTKIIDRNKILIDPLIFDLTEDNVPNALKPLFDITANACGLKQSLSYDEKGDWLHIEYLRRYIQN